MDTLDLVASRLNGEWAQKALQPGFGEFFNTLFRVLDTGRAVGSAQVSDSVG